MQGRQPPGVGYGEPAHPRTKGSNSRSAAPAPRPDLPPSPGSIPCALSQAHKGLARKLNQMTLPSLRRPPRPHPTQHGLRYLAAVSCTPKALPGHPYAPGGLLSTCTANLSIHLGLAMTLSVAISRRTQAGAVPPPRAVKKEKRRP